jgi:hypothetical protein
MSWLACDLEINSSSRKNQNQMKIKKLKTEEIKDLLRGLWLNT